MNLRSTRTPSGVLTVGHKKTGSWPVFSLEHDRGLRQGPHHFIQSALMPGSLILVNNALVDHSVDDRYGACVVGRRGSLVARFNRLDDILDKSTHFRTLRHVVLASLFTLSGALACRFNVGHGKTRLIQFKTAAHSRPDQVGCQAGNSGRLGRIPARITG